MKKLIWIGLLLLVGCQGKMGDRGYTGVPGTPGHNGAGFHLVAELQGHTTTGGTFGYGLPAWLQGADPKTTFIQVWWASDVTPNDWTPFGDGTLDPNAPNPTLIQFFSINWTTGVIFFNGMFPLSNYKIDIYKIDS